MVRPVYPEIAKQARIEGKVSLRCIVGRDGSVETIEVRSGHPLFLPAATKAVSQWKYKPLVLNGRAVTFETTIDIHFQLPEQKKEDSRESPTR